jgi:hypothetical protein
MFALNKEAREYISSNFITVRNGFINEGLIVLSFGEDDFTNYDMLEKQYFQALKRNP